MGVRITLKQSICYLVRLPASDKIMAFKKSHFAHTWVEKISELFFYFLVN